MDAKKKPRWDSNPQPSACKANTLTTTLHQVVEREGFIFVQLTIFLIFFIFRPRQLHYHPYIFIKIQNITVTICFQTLHVINICTYILISSLNSSLN